MSEQRAMPKSWSGSSTPTNRDDTILEFFDPATPLTAGSESGRRSSACVSSKPGSGKRSPATTPKEATRCRPKSSQVRPESSAKKTPRSKVTPACGDNELYLMSIAKIYDVSYMREWKRQQYWSLLQRQKKHGSCPQWTFNNYHSYLLGHRTGEFDREDKQSSEWKSKQRDCKGRNGKANCGKRTTSSGRLSKPKGKLESTKEQGAETVYPRESSRGRTEYTTDQETRATSSRNRKRSRERSTEDQETGADSSRSSSKSRTESTTDQETGTASSRSSSKSRTESIKDLETRTASRNSNRSREPSTKDRETRTASSRSSSKSRTESIKDQESETTSSRSSISSRTESTTDQETVTASSRDSSRSRVEMTEKEVSPFGDQ